MPFTPLITPVKAQGAGGNLGPNNGAETIEWTPELYPNWKYRIKLNVSEPGFINRVNEPVNVFLTFEDNQAKLNSFRVMMYNSSGWFNVTTQVWNYTLYQPSGFVKTATVTFLVNMTKSQSSIYYLYYTAQNVPSIQYKPFITSTNGSFTSPGSSILINYTRILAQSYEAQVDWQYGYLTDFVVNGQDLVGEYYRKTYPIETGVITDFNNDWREELQDLPSSDTASLVDFTSGPIFTRIALNKTSTVDEYAYIYRVWTFYPNYWTVDVTVKFSESQNYLIYSRIFHNGSRTYYPTYEGQDDVIDGATITLKYYRAGQNYTRTATINGAGGAEKLQTSLTTPYWYAVYKSSFAYSCIPASGSEVNYFYYYDDVNQNPYHYGAAGWAYYSSQISTSKNWYAQIVYTPHEGQTNSSFAEIDYLKIYNPLRLQKFSVEYYRDNLVSFALVDYSNNPVAGVKTQLYNVSGTQFVGNSTSNETGIVVYTKLYDYTYNLTVWYNISGVEKKIAEASISFTANYTRTAYFKINCSVNLASIRLIDGRSGSPLYNYTIIVNSTANSLNVTGVSDDYGWYNISLLTEPSSLYGVTVKNPAGVLKADNISIVDIKLVPCIIVNVTEPDSITSLTLLSYSIQLYSGTNPGGRSTPNQLPVEIYWGDSLTFTVEFRNLTGDSGIIDASTRNWSIYYENMSLITSGLAVHWDEGKYNFTVSSADYGDNWGQRIYLKIEFSRSGCVTPPVLTIPIHVKTWDTSLSTSPVNSAWAYWRENITISVEYSTNLTDSLLDLSDGSTFTAYVSGVGYVGFFTDHPSHNGTVILSINLTDYGLGSYTLTVTASLTHYASKHASLQIHVLPVPTYGSWSSSSLYMYENESEGEYVLKGAFGESIPITVEAYNNATQSFPSEPLIGGIGVYVWDKGSGRLNDSGLGSYTGSLSLTGLTSDDEGLHFLSVIISLDNRTPLEFYITVEVIQSWETRLTLISRNPSGSVPWGNNITFTLKYECSETPRNGLPLDDAVLSLDWPLGYWYHISRGNGLYDVIVNSSAYSITGDITDILLTKTFSISKQYYKLNSLSTSIGITRIPGVVHIYVDGVRDPSEFYLVILDNKTINVDFKVFSSSSIFNNKPVTGANLTAVIRPREGGGWNLTTSLVEVEPGVYRLIINSTQIQPIVNTPYELALEIYAQKDNYQQLLHPQTFYFTLRPIRVGSTVLSVEGGRLEGSLITVNQGDQITLRFKVEDLDHQLTLTGATVTALLKTGSQILKSYSAQNVGGGVYEFNISTGDLEGAYTLIVEVNAGDNYSILTVQYNFQVITPFPLMLVVLLAAVSAVSIPVGYKGVRYYQWIRKPSQIRKILTSIAYIKKMKNFEITSPATREDNINSKLGELLSDPLYSDLKDFIIRPVSKIEVAGVPSNLYAQLSDEVNRLLPALTEAERKSLIDELVNLPSDERELLLKSIVEEQKGKLETRLFETETPIVEEEALKKPVEARDRIIAELSKMVNEGLITEDEKNILAVELADLPVEEQNKFLEKLKSRWREE